ncbi:MAG: thiamine diphosphokinase [Tateyamaria sp.]|nr:thiamine diphosphokinase [Tateyamaria sp.]MDG1419894.1 thiamine diphosphokinase [Tateyamaria sp.]MDG2377967.1 thiamine diphosphokinase [Tateyamaria sp.]
MTNLVFSSSIPLTLVGGGVASLQDLLEAMTYAPTCIAADGGAKLALEAGVELAAVIGDFDSIGQCLSQVPVERRIHISEQDSTDFDKAMRYISAPLVIAIGFTGGRIDHQLAALNVLVKYPQNPCVMIGEQELIFLCPPGITLPLLKGDVVSLFPMAPVAGTSTGLNWEIDGLCFDPIDRIGTSNVALGPVRLTMDRPAMLIMVPRKRLEEVIRVLLQPPEPEKWN